MHEFKDFIFGLNYKYIIWEKVACTQIIGIINSNITSVLKREKKTVSNHALIFHFYSRRAHASKKKLLKCRTPKCELDDEEADVARTMKRVEDDNMTSRHKVSKRPKTKKASKKEKIRAVHPKFQHKLKKVNSTSNITAKKVKKHKKKSRLPTQQNEKRTKLTHPDTGKCIGQLLCIKCIYNCFSIA